MYPVKATHNSYQIIIKLRLLLGSIWLHPSNAYYQYMKSLNQIYGCSSSQLVDEDYLITMRGMMLPQSPVRSS